ncbi:tail fiber domain-containing protein [Ligilactobacillus apodemi]|uniref:tail fiber domain-containing protein n=1 Tax=Ligilactobacillus apodemi TaxID=307126 RepID=UPI00214C8610|nr:tail fiber domain-containing protein [Ligilactobacillus apodemi]MCR1900860.1 tail fiber domain-containing protein [Ligilactobacillus apodemi]
MRAVSALKYKKDVIRTYTDNYGEKLLQLPTATWLDKNEVESSMTAQRHFGMIAEDFADNDLDIFVTRDANGEIEGLQYDRIAPALIPVIRNLKTKVDNLDKIAKKSIVDTSQGKTAINAYETAEYYFGDIAKTNTGVSRRVKIMIDPLFLETINTDIDYHVFVSSYSNGYAWVSEMSHDYFVIESNVPNLSVSYEIKAKRKQYENVRLDKVDVNLTGGTK